MSPAHARLNLSLLALYLACAFLYVFPGVKLELMRFGTLGPDRVFLGYFPNLLTVLPIHWGIQSLTLMGALYALLLPVRSLRAIVPWLVLYSILALVDVRIVPLSGGVTALGLYLVVLGVIGIYDSLRPQARFRLVLPRAVWPIALLIALIAALVQDPALLAVLVVLIHPGWIPARKGELIVFFDGHCGLCNQSVDFLIQEDATHRHLRFAALQSPAADLWRKREVLPAMNPDGNFDSLVVAEGETIFERSDAILKTGEHLGGLWRVGAQALRLIPRGLRDGVYGLIAKHRYRFFGRRETCRLPTKQERAFFL